MKPTAAVYSRVSLEQQADNFSLASQRRAMLKLAAEKGFTVPKEFEFSDPGGLGGEIDRPGLTALRAAARSGAVKAVIVYDPDRLSRKLVDLLLITEEFERHGVSLLFVNGSVDATPEGKAMLSMRGIFSELEKAKLRERSMRGRREKALQGFFSGNPPFGFEYRGRAEGSRGELVIDSAQAEIVRRIFRMADEGVKLLDIARKLTAEGAATATGAAWAKGTLAAMLRNSAYTGEARANRRMKAEPARRRRAAEPGKSKKTSFRPRPSDEWISVPVPAIIDRVLFDRVRAKLEQNRHANSGRPSDRYLLRGLLRCGKCGRPLYTYPNGNRPYARCGNFDRLTGKRHCDAERAWVADVEARVLGEVEQMKLDPDRIFRLAEEAHARRAADSRGANATRSRLEAEIAKLKRREARAAAALMDADLADSAAVFREALRSAQAARRKLEADLRIAMPAPPSAFPKAFFTDFAKRYLYSLHMDPRAAITSCVERVIVHDAEKFEICFRFEPDPGEGGVTNCETHQHDARPRHGPPA
jgi:site-specific DNA recombinase